MPKFRVRPVPRLKYWSWCRSPRFVSGNIALPVSTWRCRSMCSSGEYFMPAAIARHNADGFVASPSSLFSASVADAGDRLTLLSQSRAWIGYDSMKKWLADTDVDHARVAGESRTLTRFRSWGPCHNDGPCWPDPHENLTKIELCEPKTRTRNPGLDTQNRTDEIPVSGKLEHKGLLFLLRSLRYIRVAPESQIPPMGAYNDWTLAYSQNSVVA